MAVIIGALAVLVPRVTAVEDPQGGGEPSAWKFVDRSLIQADLGGPTIDFIDTDPFDDDLEYEAIVNECPANIKLPKDFEVGNLGGFPGSISPNNIHLQRLNPNGTSPRCLPLPATKSIPNADEGARTYFQWVDAGTISSVDGNDVFEKHSDGEFRKVGENECIDRIYVSGNKGTYFELDVKDGIDPDKFKTRGKEFSGCKVFAVNYWGVKNKWGSEGEMNDNMVRLAGIAANIGATENTSKPPGSGAVPGRNSQIGQSKGNSCSVNIGGFPLAWALCPVLELADALATSLMRLFENQLPFSITEGGGRSGETFTQGLGQVKAAWTIVKNLSSALLIIALLIMVISQAVSWGPQIEAYTVRKLLPRMVAAIILMQLSWTLVVWVVNLFNDIGKGLGDLLYAPFGGASNLDFGHLLANAGIGTGEGIFLNWLVILVGAVLLLAGLASVFFFAVVAILSLVTGLALLVFRKILIIMLLILSPLAFAIWILPGQTMQRYWKMWLDNLIKVLAMYPLIIALIASGRIFAYVVGANDVGTQGGSGSFINFWFIMIGYFVPLFLLPMTFKWGGGMMLAVSGAAAGLQNRLQSRTLEKPIRDYAKRKQNQIFDQKFKGLDKEEAERRLEGREPSSREKWKGRAKRQLWRTVGGRPWPSHWQQSDKKSEVAEWKKEELDRWERDIHDDFKEALGRGMPVGKAKEFVRDKYRYTGNEYKERAFDQWAYHTRSFQEMGTHQWRRGGHWNRDKQEWEAPPGGWKEDIAKNGNFVSQMNGDQNMYRDYGAQLPAIQPFHTKAPAVYPEPIYEQLGGEKLAKGQQPRNKQLWEAAQRISDDKRMKRMLDNLQNTGDIGVHRPEQFAEIADITADLSTVKDESGNIIHKGPYADLAAKIDYKPEAAKTLRGMLLEEGSDFYRKQRIAGLMGGQNSAEQYIDKMFGPGFMAGIFEAPPGTKDEVEAKVQGIQDQVVARQAQEARAAGRPYDPPPPLVTPPPPPRVAQPAPRGPAGGVPTYQTQTQGTIPLHQFGAGGPAAGQSAAPVVVNIDHAALGDTMYRAAKEGFRAGAREAFRGRPPGAGGIADDEGPPRPGQVRDPRGGYFPPTPRPPGS